MFYQAGMKATTFKLDGISNWDVSNVKYMNNMFDTAGYYSNKFELDLSKWDVSKVTNMKAMFRHSGNGATSWTVGDISDWNVSNVENMIEMFSAAGYSSDEFILDLSRWNVSKVSYADHLFSNSGKSARTWSIGDLSNWNLNIRNSGSLFFNAGAEATTWNSIGTLNVYATDISWLFKGCHNAKATINLYNNPTSYNMAFDGSSTIDGSGIVVNYVDSVTNIDNIIATKSSTSNVTKGVILNTIF